MFNRLIISDLKYWLIQPDRKPLIIRGARQVGKTSVVNMFAENFKQYIYLNLEIEEDKLLFEKKVNFEQLVESIFYAKRKKLDFENTLLFIDEIQNSAAAVQSLRYFYESGNKLAVIAAGSLFETHTNTQTSFPVGRVEYMVLRPFSFAEYLNAVNEQFSIEILNNIPIPEYAHDALLKHFKTYTLIGGMPEAVAKYAQTKDVLKLNRVFESLIGSYLDDVEKYAANTTMRHVLRHIISNSFTQAGKRIKFEGFGNSNYKSREMGEAFRLLEKIFLVSLVYPAQSTGLPTEPDYKKSPRLQWLDTGLVNYFARLQSDVFSSQFIDDVYDGKIAEHIVCQEIVALQNSILYKPNFWTREKSDSSAEVDLLYQFENKVIPIEVKAGATGKLRSLFEFVDVAPHNFAVRVYSGKLSVEKAKTIRGKEFYLLNLPFYLLPKLNEYLQWFVNQENNCE